MNKRIMLAGVLACASMGAGSAKACATVSFSPASISITNWDPINGAQLEFNFQSTINRASSSTKKFRMIFRDTNNNSSPLRVGLAGPIYQVQTSAGENVSFPQGTMVNVTSPTGLDAIATDAASVQANFKIVIPANAAQQDFVGNANFSESPTWAIQCLNNGGQADGTATGTGPALSLTIPKLVSIVTAGPQTLNFGSFTIALQQLNIGLKSTSNISVAVATQNNNQLALANAPTPFAANSVIPYTMTLNGKAITNGTLLTNETRAGVAGTSWPFVLSLTGGLPSDKVAGTYSDTITLTLTPN